MNKTVDKIPSSGESLFSRGNWTKKYIKHTVCQMLSAKVKMKHGKQVRSSGVAGKNVKSSG